MDGVTTNFSSVLIIFAENLKIINMYIILILFILLLLHQLYLNGKTIKSLENKRDYYKSKYNMAKEHLCSKN